MKYSEYKNNIKVPAAEAKTERNCKINSLEEYIALRRRTEEYTCCTDVSEELTADDYSAFEKNLQKIMDMWDWTDPENGIEKSHWEKIHKHMDTVVWTWGGKRSVPTVDDLKHCVVHLFESCINSGYPKAMSSTGGFTVCTDIIEHQVRVIFSVEDDATGDDCENVY
jgi:hypothetical protein